MRMTAYLIFVIVFMCGCQFSTEDPCKDGDEKCSKNSLDNNL